jgi:hypothetical protein
MSKGVRTSNPSLYAPDVLRGRRSSQSRTPDSHPAVRSCPEKPNGTVSDSERRRHSSYRPTLSGRHNVRPVQANPETTPERLWASRANRRPTLRTVHAPFARMRAQQAPGPELGEGTTKPRQTVAAEQIRKAVGVDLSPPQALSLAPSDALSRMLWTVPQLALASGAKKTSRGPTPETQTHEQSEVRSLLQTCPRSRAGLDLSSLPAGIHPRRAGPSGSHRVPSHLSIAPSHSFRAASCGSPGLS